jgi:hypothetical protein
MSVPRLLTHNLSWKLIALVSAMLVWLALRPARIQGGAARTFRQVPITVLTAAEDGRAFRLEPGTVDVEVSGAPEVLPRLRLRDFRAFVDLTSVAEARPLRLRVEVHTPFGVTLDKVAPAEVTGRILPPPSPES